MNSNLKFTKNGIPYNKYNLEDLERDSLILITGTSRSARTNLALDILQTYYLDHDKSILVTDNTDLTKMLPSTNQTTMLESHLMNATNIGSVLEDEDTFVLIDSFLRDDHFIWMNSYAFDLFRCASNLRIITVNKLTDLPEELWSSVDLIFVLHTDVYVEARKLYSVYFHNYPHYHTFIDDFRDLTKDNLCVVKDNRNHKIYYYEAQNVKDPITGSEGSCEEYDPREFVVKI